MAGDGPTSTERWRNALTGQVMAWSALVAVTVLLVAVTWPIPPSDQVSEVEGPWSAAVPGGEPAPILLPTLNPSLPFDPSPRVVFATTVDVPSGLARPALEVTAANYLVAVRWDGAALYDTPLDAGGQPELTEQGQLIGLPDGTAPGRHRLEIELQPRLGRLGVLHAVRLGPTRELRHIQRRRDGAEVGFSLGLFLLAIVHLSVAGATGRWTAHLWFGLFLGALGTFTWGNADASYAMFTDAETRYRLVRVAYGLTPGLGLAFMRRFLGYWGQADRAVLAFGAGVAIAGLLLPDVSLYRLEQVQDLTTLAILFAMAFSLAESWRSGTPGAGLLGLATLPLILASMNEMAVTHGLYDGESILFPGLVLFVATSAAGLSIGDARESERHRRLVGGSMDAMLIVDVQGRIAVANPAVETMLGAGIAREGDSLFHVVFAEDRPLLRAHVARSVTRPDRAEFRCTVAGRELVVESLATPVDEGTVLLVLRDITRRRQVDRGLLQAARMETVALLVGGIAHDFNNMLGNLLAQIGLMQGSPGTPDVTKRLSRMESTIERASLLTRRLLTVSGGTTSDLVGVDVAAVCRGALELVEPSLPATVEVTLDLPADLPPALGAHADLEHVLVNLIVNARDAIDGHGKIRIAARRFVAESGARGVAICVEDDGPGVPPHLRADIFEPFFTTKPPNRGSGLGLAVASQILRDHYARLWLEDRPGGGARFLIALRGGESIETGPVALPAGHRVLLVEDEPALLDSYGKALADAGYDVTARGSGHEAWEDLHGAPPDILVTDVVMPGFSGLDLAALCAERYPAVPVLLVSGFIPDPQLAPLAKGSWFRLDKPVRPARLVATVGRLLRRAERAERGELAVTEVTALFPSLDALTAEAVGL